MADGIPDWAARERDLIEKTKAALIAKTRPIVEALRAEGELVTVTLTISVRTPDAHVTISDFGMLGDPGDAIGAMENGIQVALHERLKIAQKNFLDSLN